MNDQNILIKISVKDPATKADLIPPKEIPMNTDISKLNGVINHIAYMIPKLIDVDEQQLLGNFNGEPEND